MFRFAPIFQDHAVLQRDISLPIWGWAEPGTSVQIRLAGATATVETATTGRWLLRLPPLPAGGPYDLEATNCGQKLLFKDIYLGDVWLCSGQSNAAWQLHQSDPDNLQARDAHYPLLRLLTVNTPVLPGPQCAIDGLWKMAVPETLAHFSAIGGWFGRTLQEELNVPIGIITNAWGGTRIQAWISREALMTDPDGAGEVAAYEAEAYQLASEESETKYSSLEEWARTDGPQGTENLGLPKGWAEAEFDDRAWPLMEVPSIWQQQGFPHNGILWFRFQVTCPAAWQGRDLLLHLGSVDKHDDTYVNGVRVGGISWENPDAWCTPRVYPISARLAGEEGRITIAVRVRSSIFDGGLRGPEASMRLLPVGVAREEGIPLAGQWRWQVEADWSSIVKPSEFGNGPTSPNAASAMFHSRLHALMPYGLRGVIWYQGESNASEGSLYRRLLPLMISDWRRIWGQGDFPFLQVQLANYMAPADEPGDSSWAELRDAQASGLALPGVGLATAIDVGEADDIHPRNKKDVGLRLARLALSRVYERGGLPGGPLFSDTQEEPEGRWRILFDCAEGLTTQDGAPVRHLAISDAEGHWRWAHSRIEGETLLVWHPEIFHSTAVRYAWADNPEGCNLVNGEGLPAFPFDTRTTYRMPKSNLPQK